MSEVVVMAAQILSARASVGRSGRSFLQSFYGCPSTTWWSRRRQNHTQVSRSDCSIGSTGRSSAWSTTFLTRSRSTGSGSQTVWLP